MKNGPGRDDPSSEISSSLFFPSWWGGGGKVGGGGGVAKTGKLTISKRAERGNSGGFYLNKLKVIREKVINPSAVHSIVAQYKVKGESRTKQTVF